MFVGEIKYMRNFKKNIGSLFIPFFVILGLQIVKFFMRNTSIESNIKTVLVLVYFFFVATKAKNRKLILIIICLTTVISFHEFNLMPTYCISVFANDHRLNMYLPILIFIVLSEFILSKQYLIMLVDRKVFLTIFRVKHILSLVIIPRLWFGDQSIVLKSHLFSTYLMLFWGSTFLIALWILYESLFALFSKANRYLSIIPHDMQGDSHTDPHTLLAILKQTKFEIILLFSLNLLPAYIFLKEQALVSQSLYQILT